jgi:hypothetical protein
MNRREICSEVFISPKDGNKRHKAIHLAGAWRARVDDDTADFHLPFGTSTDSNDTTTTAVNRRKRRLREAKEKAVTESVEAQQHRQQQHEQAMLYNQKMQLILEHRRILGLRLKEDLAMEKAEIKAKAREQQPKRKRRLKKIIRRKIIKTVLRKQPPPPPPVEEPSKVEIEEDDDFTEVEFHEDEESEQYVEEELLEDSKGNLQAVIHDDDEDDEDEIIFEDEDDDDIVEETFHEDDDEVEVTFHEDDDEEQFFASIRAVNDDDEVGLSLRTEEEQFQREQEELFRLAAERQAEEEEDLLWEEEELRREQEARRLAEEEELRLKQLTPEEQRTQTLQDLIRSRPSLQPTSTKKTKHPDEESVLDREIGYRAPSLLALVNQAKLEMRPPPPEEHKEEFKPVVEDAASIARFLRLDEHVIEAQGKRDIRDFNTNSTDSSYSTWEKNHSQRGQSRKPVQRGNRSKSQIMVNEAATLGKLRSKRDKNETHHYTHAEEIDIDDLGDDKYDGAKVFRTEHLIDRHVGRNRTTDWTPDYDDEEYRALDDVKLPTPNQPRFISKTTKKTEQELREELSQTVAEGYWSRYYRLERPGAKLNVTPGCFCKYCGSANAWQTYAYQKKWADERLPQKELLSENEDPSKYGYIARLYLPDETPDDIEFVDLDELDEPSKKDYDLGSLDGNCSVDFSLGSLDMIGESDESDESEVFRPRRPQKKKDDDMLPNATKDASTPVGNADATSTTKDASTPVGNADATSPTTDTITPVGNTDVASNVSFPPDSVASSRLAVESSALRDAVVQRDSVDALASAAPPEISRSTPSGTQSQQDSSRSPSINSNEKKRTFNPLKWMKKTLLRDTKKNESDLLESSNNVQTPPPISTPAKNPDAPLETQKQPVPTSLLKESHPRSTEVKDAKDADIHAQVPVEPKVVAQYSDSDTVVVSNAVSGDAASGATQNDLIQVSTNITEDIDVSKPPHNEGDTGNQLQSTSDNGSVDQNTNENIEVDSENALHRSSNDTIQHAPAPVKRKKGILAELKAKRESIEQAKLKKPPSVRENETQSDDLKPSSIAHSHETSAAEQGIVSKEGEVNSKDLENVPVKQKLSILGELRAKKEALAQAKAVQLDSQTPDVDVEENLHKSDSVSSTAKPDEASSSKMDTHNMDKQKVPDVTVKRKIGILGQLKAKREALEQAKATEIDSKTHARDKSEKQTGEESSPSTSVPQPDKTIATGQSLAKKDKLNSKDLDNIPVKRKSTVGELIKAKEEAARQAKATATDSKPPPEKDTIKYSGASPAASIAPSQPNTLPTMDPVLDETTKAKVEVRKSVNVPVKQQLGMLGELRAKKEAARLAKATATDSKPPPEKDAIKKVEDSGASQAASIAPSQPKKPSTMDPVLDETTKAKGEVRKSVNVPVKQQLGMLGELRAKKEALERAKSTKRVSKVSVKPRRESVVTEVGKLETGSEHQCVPPWGDLNFGNFSNTKKEEVEPSSSQEKPSWKNAESLHKETEEVAQAGRVSAFFMGGGR